MVTIHSQIEKNERKISTAGYFSYLKIKVSEDAEMPFST